MDTTLRSPVSAEPSRPRKLGMVPRRSDVRRSSASMSGPTRRPMTEQSRP
jgi:hypothetical protein